MTQQEAAKALRERRNQLIPESLGLRFGCEVDYGGKIYTYCGNGKYSARFFREEIEEGADIVRPIDHGYTILGSPVSLNDVLRMMYMANPANITNIRIECSGDVAVRRDDDTYLIVHRFDLTKSPEEWDAETLQWILDVTK